MQKHFTVISLTFLSLLTTETYSLPTLIYPAEIVGRNLNVFGMGWAGHVGITTAADISQPSNQVIEVMNDTPVIQVHSLLEFKLKTTYWGSRYGISDRGEQGTKIINEANFQRGLCPIYTMTAAYEPGTGYDEEGKPTHCGVFRCDTFINYVFHTAGYDLPTYNSFTLPVTVFSAFPKGHGDGPLAQEAQSIIKNLNPVSSSFSLKNVEVNELAQMNFEEFMATIDQPTANLTKEMIDKAWNFAQNPALVVEKKVLIIDYLGLAGTVELIPKFIAEYTKVDNKELKSMLLRSTFTLYQKYLWLKNYPNERNELHNFYSRLLTEKLSARDSELVLRGLINLDSSVELESKMNKFNFIINNLNSNANVGLWIELAMKSKNLERQSIPQILSLLNRENNPDLDDIFNQFVVRRLSKLGINALEAESKNLISNHLQSLSYRYNSSGLKSSITGLSLPYYGAWLEASALVNSDSLQDAADYVSNFIQNKSDINKANFYSGLSEGAYIKKALKR
ncbi:MAG: hypothetical protein H0U57_10710 [Tatlockia sp.]|nr:hypothetical protein [Tatlockia sp.]